ncbi:uncharacterized protein LOC128556743 [Mercenaria mercenaria]|uniref:uncharacterized protein LOC128556743 n=1 Tax=Mercenaria mercenaria TaxID=6596 RepID=UPI00234F930A|nr:uncharacterized protein LOC128556743 [Mercenaria mercenaria]
MKNFSFGSAVVVILSVVIFLDEGICQQGQQNYASDWRKWAGTMGNGAPGSGNPQYQSGGEQNWAGEWRKWAGTMGNGEPGAAGSGNPWLQMADQYMRKWMNGYAARKANGTNQSGGFFANLMDGYAKKWNGKKNKKKGKEVKY